MLTNLLTLETAQLDLGEWPLRFSNDGYGEVVERAGRHIDIDEVSTLTRC